MTPTTTTDREDSNDDGWVAFDTDVAEGFFAEAASVGGTVATSTSVETSSVSKDGIKFQQEQEERLQALKAAEEERKVREEALLKAQVHARLREQERARRKAREEQFRIIAEEEEKKKKKKAEAAATARTTKVKVQEIAIVQHFPNDEDEKEPVAREEANKPTDRLPVPFDEPEAGSPVEVDLEKFQQIAEQQGRAAAEKKMKEAAPARAEQKETPTQQEKAPGSPKKKKKGWFRSSKRRASPKPIKENSSSQTKPAAPTQEKQATTPAAADVVPKKKMPRKNKTKSKKKQHRKTAISDGEASIGVDSDMDTRAFMEEYDKREGKPYDAVIQKLGLFVCGSACATDDSIYEEVSISSPPRKKTREFDTIAPKGTRTSIGGGSTKPQKSKQSLVDGVVSDCEDDNTDNRTMQSEDDGQSEFDGESYVGSEFTASTAQPSFMGNGFFF